MQGNFDSLPLEESYEDQKDEDFFKLQKDEPTEDFKLYTEN
jgi:hypothetical protein